MSAWKLGLVGIPLEMGTPPVVLRQGQKNATQVSTPGWHFVVLPLCLDIQAVRKRKGKWQLRISICIHLLSSFRSVQFAQRCVEHWNQNECLGCICGRVAFDLGQWRLETKFSGIWKKSYSFYIHETVFSVLGSLPFLFLSVCVQGWLKQCSAICNQEDIIHWKM